MEISNIIDREQTFSLDLTHPVTAEPLGIVFNVRSIDSAEAKAVLRRHTDANLERMQKRKPLRGAEVERQSLETVAACIVSWDWGKNTWRGTKPEFSMSAAIDILGAENWIFAQVDEAVSTVANFTPSSEKVSPKPSA